jgi:N-acetylmuramoyl-L-alanine amidase
MRLSSGRGALIVLLACAALAGCQHQATGTMVPSIFTPAPPQPPPPYTPPTPGAIPAAWDVQPQREWKYIVIHHSASEKGNAAVFDAEHRARGWQCLGYDFVIDNGNGGPDGRVEVGPRWPQQIQGAHTGKTPGNAYNEVGIGICLVGDFTSHMPTAGQLASLQKLTLFLCRRYGISPSNVIGHRDAPGAHTECPGDQLHAYVHGTLRQVLKNGR